MAQIAISGSYGGLNHGALLLEPEPFAPEWMRSEGVRGRRVLGGISIREQLGDIR